MKTQNFHQHPVPQFNIISIALLVLGLALAAQTAQALTNSVYITNTTYLDSRVSNQTLNYGHAHTVKVVIDSPYTSDGSVCRGLLQLPAAIWQYSPDEIVSAKISFYVWQDYTEDRNITLYPLTTKFVPGTGSASSPADGATWLTRDGTNAWSSAGGDYDTSFSVIGIKDPVLDVDENNRFFTWDITMLLKTPASRAELQNFGALLRIDETPVPQTGMPRAPFTSCYDPSYTSAYWPVVQLTIAPRLLSPALAAGTVSFAMTNLTIGTTYTIERTTDLVSSNWTAAASFTATDITNVWSEPAGAGATNVFYRLHSRE
jgi:hypothetical protein